MVRLRAQHSKPHTHLNWLAIDFLVRDRLLAAVLSLHRRGAHPKVLLLIAAISVSACTIAPYKKPLDETTSSKFAKPAVYARADDRGVGVQYFAQDSSATGAQYGLIGALVSATIDAIANASPYKIAENGADALVPKFDHQKVTADFVSALNTQLITLPSVDPALTIQPLDKTREWTAAAFTEPVVLLTSVEYVLTQDFRSLEVALMATAVSRDAAAEAAKAKKNAKSDAGRIYRNRFEYYSTPLAPFGEKTPEQLEQEITQIKTDYGKVKPNSTAAMKMKKEIEQARKRMPADEKAKHYLDLWLADDAALLRRELLTGLTTVSELLAKDLQDPTPVDVKATQPKTILVDGTERVVVRSNLHPFMGSLRSEPLNFTPPMANGVWYRQEKKAAPEGQVAAK
jgi:hypothetical protein